MTSPERKRSSRTASAVGSGIQSEMTPRGTGGYHGFSGGARLNRRDDVVHFLTMMRSPAGCELMLPPEVHEVHRVVVRWQELASSAANLAPIKSPRNGMELAFVWRAYHAGVLSLLSPRYCAVGSSAGFSHHGIGSAAGQSHRPPLERRKRRRHGDDTVGLR